MVWLCVNVLCCRLGRLAQIRGVLLLAQGDAQLACRTHSEAWACAEYAAIAAPSLAGHVLSKKALAAASLVAACALDWSLLGRCGVWMGGLCNCRDTSRNLFICILLADIAQVPKISTRLCFQEVGRFSRPSSCEVSVKSDSSGERALNSIGPATMAKCIDQTL